MIFERLDFKIDIERLQEHFREHVLPLPFVGGAKMFGGWSVLSSDGSYQDGWHKGHVDPGEADPTTKSAKSSRDYIVPTEICHSYLLDVIRMIKNAKLYPSRARIIRLAEETVTFKHRDHSPEGYNVRIHLPIITNDQCFFEIEGEKAHMPADGSLYLVNVNRVHWVSNNGPTPRYQMVVDVRDIHGLTKHHRYDDRIVEAQGSLNTK